jgi:sialate O-acetylesterase
MRKLVFLFIIANCLVPVLSGWADVTIPALFGYHMVLQQNAKIPVWGWADPGELIQVSLGGKQLRTEATAEGKWRVEFAPLAATDKPMELNIAGKNAINIPDVVVGEVWVASGQSNMSYPLDGSLNGKDVLAKGNDPLLRFYDVEGHPGIRPKTVGAGHWHSDNVNGCSAVAFFFAQQLRQKLNVPVGILQAAWGGQPIETFMSREALEKIPGTADKLAEIAKEEAAFPKDPAAQKAAMDDFGKRLNDWDEHQNKPFLAAEQKWQADVAAAKAANQPPPPEPTRPPDRPKSPDGQEGDYTTLYNGMIAPITGYPIKGALWYQGEANTGDTQEQYAALLRGMIEDWRGRWKSDFDFLVVGLANCGDRHAEPVDSGWAEVRAAEASISATDPHAGIAEAIDVGAGHNIHPLDKQDVGKRLAAVALHVAYGQNVPYAGPRFAGMAVEGNKIRVKFTNVDAGLALGLSPYVSTDAMFDNPQLSTTDPLAFEIAGADKKWVAAKAQLDGKDILVWADQVAVPAAVRYAWQDNPPANVYNKDGFPAVPFRTQDWRVNPR